MEIYKPEKILRLHFEKDIFTILTNCIFKGTHSKIGQNIFIIFESGTVFRDWRIREIYNIPYRVNNFYKLLE